MPGITERLIDHYKTHPNAAILLSGAGSNARSLLCHPTLSESYNIIAVCTDNPASNARNIATEYDLECVVEPADKFIDTSDREAYFDKLGSRLGDLGVTAAFYAGFMKISTPKFCENILGVNVHPADLTIIDYSGLPLYRGIDALVEMRKNEGKVAATVHVVDSLVDSGTALSITKSIIPFNGESNVDLHSRLKNEEHQVFPETLVMLGEGQLTHDDLPVRFS